MASKITTCQLQLDENATKIAETVPAMLEAQGRTETFDSIVSNAVRIAYGDRIESLVKDAMTVTAKDMVG